LLEGSGGDGVSIGKKYIRGKTSLVFREKVLGGKEASSSFSG